MMTMKRMRMVTTMMKLVRSVSSRSSGSSIAGQEDRVGASRELFVTPSISEIFVPITTRSPRGYVQLRASRDRRERLASRRGCLNWSVGIRSFHFFFFKVIFLGNAPLGKPLFIHGRTVSLDGKFNLILRC